MSCDLKLLRSSVQATPQKHLWANVRRLSAFARVPVQVKAAIFGMLKIVLQAVPRFEDHVTHMDILVVDSSMPGRSILHLYWWLSGHEAWNLVITKGIHESDRRFNAVAAVAHVQSNHAANGKCHANTQAHWLAGPVPV